jgi:hypothetical protein
VTTLPSGFYRRRVKFWFKHPIITTRRAIKKWTNRPRPEDYLPFSTTHQHKQTWRWPFLGMCVVFLVLVVLVGVLLGKQAQQAKYIEQNRKNMCDILEVIQYQNQRELYRAYNDLDCQSLR